MTHGGGGLTLLVRRRKPFFYFMPGYPGASRAFAIRKLLIAAACDTRIRVSQAVHGGRTQRMSLHEVIERRVVG